MFSKLSSLFLIVPLASALVMDTPTNWTSQGSVVATWTTNSGDPPSFSLELINQAFNDAFAIANNVMTATGSLSLTLPVVPEGSGYTIQAVALGNISDIFASSGSFSIGPASTSVASSSATPTGAGTSAVPSFTPLTTTPFGVTQSQTSIPAGPPTTTGTTGPTGTAAGFSGASALRFSLTTSNIGAGAVLLLASIAGVAAIAL